MIDVEKIVRIAEQKLSGSDMFVVEAKVQPDNDVELLIDSDSSVSIDACVELSRAIEAEFDRDVEDFSLTVSSAGIGQPLKLHRQYLKLVGSPVEVTLDNSTRIIARLTAATPESITLSYEEKVAVEGKKRKEKVTVTREYPLSEVRTTREYLDFK